MIRGTHSRPMSVRLAPGFTLVEVLVALVIMAVVAAMGWQGVAGMTRAREIASAASERTLRLSALVGQWEQDLAATFDSPLVPGLSFDGSALRIARRAEGGVQIVVWSLREGVWRRWTSPLVTRVGELQQVWQASQQLQGQEAGQLRLADGVSAWQIFFWRGQGWSNAQSSGDVALAASAQTPAVPALPASAASGVATGKAQRTLLPSGVRLQIDLAEGRLLRDVMLAPAP
jgi:general secretion pathway protein J